MAHRVDSSMTSTTTRKAAAAVAVALTTGGLAAAVDAAPVKPVQNGLYAPKASNKTPYSNGTVDLTVFGAGRKIDAAASGVACYTGTTPPAGVPTNAEVTIHFPHALAISANRTFSFSGPITLTPQEAESDQPIRTTFRLQGRFVEGRHGTSKAEGIDSSPLCQSARPKRFASPYAAGAG